MNKTLRKAIISSHNHLIHIMWATSGQQCACGRAKWQRLAVVIDKLRTRFGHNPWESDEEYMWERFLHWVWVKCDKATDSIYRKFPFALGKE